MGFTDMFAYVYAILSYPSPSLILSSSGLSLPLPTWSSCLLPCYPYSLTPSDTLKEVLQIVCVT